MHLSQNWMLEIFAVNATIQIFRNVDCYINLGISKDILGVRLVKISGQATSSMWRLKAMNFLLHQLACVSTVIKHNKTSRILNLSIFLPLISVNNQWGAIGHIGLCKCGFLLWKSYIKQNVICPNDVVEVSSLRIITLRTSLVPKFLPDVLLIYP